MKSGISDYSETLIKGLDKFFEITLLIDGYELENKDIYHQHTVLNYKNDTIDFSEYDYFIYNIGNNPFFHHYIYECAIKRPGLIILHDFVIYYLTVGFYLSRPDFYSKMYEIGGANAVNLIKAQIKQGKNLLHYGQAELLPLNKEPIDSGNLFMTHSWYTHDKVLKIIDDKHKLRKINHVEQLDNTFEPLDKTELFKKYNIPENTFLVSSFGYIAHTKLNDIVCKVVKKINSGGNNKICYLMVGEGEYVNYYLSNYIIKTNYTSLDEFHSFIAYSDIVVNLRSSYRGETSGSLIRVLGMGRPCIITNEGWFSELPDEIVYKIDSDNAFEMLYEKLVYFVENIDELWRISSKAKAYIKTNYNVEKISMEISDFLISAHP